MPLLDVTDVLFDPDFADQMCCIRSLERVDNDGIAQFAPRSTGFIGVVTSDKGDVLDRTDAATRIVGTITVHTTFDLTEAGEDTDADVVRWNGRDYLVSSVNDYSRFGRGFVAAICTLQPLAG